MSYILENLNDIRKNLHDDTTLVAVTKTYGTDRINEAIDCGVKDIGENKVQEILEKYDRVKQVRWHLIGHLQRNKVKQIIDKVYLIHSVDSFKLAEEIDKRAKQIDKVVNILIQVNPAGEESKFGLSIDDSWNLMIEILEKCSNIKVNGFMSVAPFEEDAEDVRKYFAEVKKLFDRAKEFNHQRLDCQYLSMGMSHDYMVALEEGSNMVRIGSSIFGRRTY